VTPPCEDQYGSVRLALDTLEECFIIRSVKESKAGESEIEEEGLTTVTCE
jgi:hypothetical protein